MDFAMWLWGNRARTNHSACTNARSNLCPASIGKPRHKALRARGKELARLLIEKAHVNPHILSLGKDGTPKHPLYLKETLKPVEWNL
jgi:hypothetical protein